MKRYLHLAMKRFHQGVHKTPGTNCRSYSSTKHFLNTELVRVFLPQMDLQGRGPRRKHFYNETDLF